MNKCQMDKRTGASILGGWRMLHHKISGGESLEIMYNVMERPVGHDGTAQDFNFSQCGTHIYLKFESYNLVRKIWFIEVLIFISKML